MFQISEREIAKYTRSSDMMISKYIFFGCAHPTCAVFRDEMEDTLKWKGLEMSPITYDVQVEEMTGL